MYSIFVFFSNNLKQVFRLNLTRNSRQFKSFLLSNLHEFWFDLRNHLTHTVIFLVSFITNNTNTTEQEGLFLPQEQQQLLKWAFAHCADNQWRTFRTAYPELQNCS